MNVTYNSAAAIASTPRVAVARLAHRDELIVVDDTSADDMLDVVAQLAPDPIVVRNQTNDGFSTAANLSARRASGDLSLFLNPDPAPAPGFTAAIRRPLRDEPRWAAWPGLVAGEQARLVNSKRGVAHFTAGQAGPRASETLRGPREVGLAAWHDSPCRARLGRASRASPASTSCIKRTSTYRRGCTSPAARSASCRTRGSSTRTPSPQAPRCAALASATAGRRSCRPIQVACSASSGRRWWPRRPRCSSWSPRTDALPRLVRQRHAIQAWHASAPAEFGGAGIRGAGAMSGDTAGSADVTAAIANSSYGDVRLEDVDSLRRQAGGPPRIVVVDDGPTEAESLAALHALVADGVDVVRPANRGVALARNAGLARVQTRTGSSSTPTTCWRRRHWPPCARCSRPIRASPSPMAICASSAT
jgi:GT2 family glycosyltransferase